MDFRIALAAALFTIALSPFGTSQDVPDGVVYTELKKTLVSGSKGVLTCRFKGTPNAVYWRKGSNPDTAPFVMSWGYGTKYGPRYEDGSCDINTNYSLVIKTVRDTDAGRYICRVSNYKGVLNHNYTDVTVTNTAVKTEPNVEVQMGEVGVLPCKVLIRPRKVSWVKGVNSSLVSMNPSGGVIDISGPGHEGWLFNMTKDYSLVIYDVNLQHEDNYSCEVTEFDTGLVYRDLTALTVYAQPREPFPIIEGCPIEDPTNCIITTDSSITLTCHVDGYYPDIKLFFMHGSKRVESIDTKIWNNTDGTKNKSTTIPADKSRDAYKCIASGIPGLGPDDEVSSSVRLFQEQRITLILTVLFVPIVLCLTVVLLFWMRLRKRGTRFSREERYMQDHISYLELWKFVEYLKSNHETYKFADLLILLQCHADEISETNMDQDYCYQQLCKWKDVCPQTINQRTALHDKCLQADLEQTWKSLKEFRENVSTEIPKLDLEHILWQIAEPPKILEFVANLGIHMPGEMDNTKRKDFVQDATNQLSVWKDGPFRFNPVIILCSTLEKLGYCSPYNNFFQIPTKEKDRLNYHDVKEFVRNLSRTHSQKLEEILNSCGGSSEINANSHLDDNINVLFNAEKMLSDWWKNSEISNYDKRCTLKRVLGIFSSNNETPAINHWPSDEELRSIVLCLDPTSMSSLCDSLKITSVQEDADEEQRFEALRQWRISTNETEWKLLYHQLRFSLKKVGCIGLLPPLRNDPVCQAEYVDIAFDLLMTDVLPAAKALGINYYQLSSYVPVFEASHLNKGTIRLVAQLVESTNNSRQDLCSRLRSVGFPLAITRNVLVHRMAYGELYEISNAMGKDEGRQEIHVASDDEEKTPGEGDGLMCENDTASIEMETALEKTKKDGSIEEPNFRKVKKMLKMTDEDLTVCPIPKKGCDEFTLFRMWKERPHFAVFNERAAIIRGLLDIQNVDVARSVAEGKYEISEISLPFLKQVLKKRDQLERFGEAFGLQKQFEGAHGSDDILSNIIPDFLTNWKDKSGPRRFHKHDKAKDYGSLIDTLVDNGFIDIARELIIISPLD